jgi:glycerol-3-phosphate acyltransferase PlsY
VFFAWFIGLAAATLAVVAIMAALLVWRHRENIRRLAAGTEARLGAKKA